jgi:hypothetical protein
MKPTQSDVHVSRPLSSILVAFMQDEKNFAARNLVPLVPVAHKTDTFYKYTRDDFWRVNAVERAPGTPSEGGGFTLTTDTYDCKEYAIHKDLADAVLDNADNELDLEGAASEYVGQQLLLKRESVVLTTFFGTSIWTGGSGGATDQAGVASAPGSNQFLQWNDAASTPIEDIRRQMRAMHEKTGFYPNKMLIGPSVADAIADHPDLLDRVKYTQKGVATLDLLASLLGLDKIMVAGGTRNTANEGQTAAFSYFAGKHAWMFYAPPSPSLMKPSAAYIFAWTTRYGNGSEGQRVKRFYMPDIESTRIEGQMNFAAKVVSAELGVFFSAAVA